MSLEVEVNVVMFPHIKPHMCTDSEAKVEWTDERKRELYQSEAEIHMIKIGPVTEEFLTRKKVGWSKVDFGIEFKLTDDGDYKWDSGEDTKGIHYSDASFICPSQCT